jgi:hypothetical protein
MMAFDIFELAKAFLVITLLVALWALVAWVLNRY